MSITLYLIPVSGIKHSVIQEGNVTTSGEAREKIREGVRKKVTTVLSVKILNREVKLFIVER